jgi:hypothetical protein
MYALFACEVKNRLKARVEKIEERGAVTTIIKQICLEVGCAMTVTGD